MVKVSRVVQFKKKTGKATLEENIPVLNTVSNNTENSSLKASLHIPMQTLNGQAHGFFKLEKKHFTNTMVWNSGLQSSFQLS